MAYTRQEITQFHHEETGNRYRLGQQVDTRGVGTLIVDNHEDLGERIPFVAGMKPSPGGVKRPLKDSEGNYITVTQSLGYDRKQRKYTFRRQRVYEPSTQDTPETFHARIASTGEHPKHYAKGALIMKKRYVE